MSTATINRSSCPAPRHGEYWMRSRFGCLCFDTRLEQAKYQYQFRRGVTRRVSSVAAVRITQGLARHGFTTAEIATMSGLSKQTVNEVQRDRRPLIRRDSDAALREAADRVRLDVAPTGPSANRARATARENGWLPLTAWDSDTIGDPGTQPRLGLDAAETVDEVAVERALSGERLRLNRLERVAAARRAAAAGMPAHLFASALHVSYTTAGDLFAAAAKPELIAS